MTTKMEIETAARNPHLAQRLAGEPVIYERAGTELVWAAGALSMAVGILTSAMLKLPENLQAAIVARYAHSTSLADFGRSIGRSRQQAHQLEAKALRVLRRVVGSYALAILRGNLKVQIIKDGPADPAWLLVPEASRLTGLSAAHIRYLCRMGRVVKRINPARRSAIQVYHSSLREYVLDNPPLGRRRKGVWIEEVSRE